MRRARRYDVLALAIVALTTGVGLAVWNALPAELVVQWGLGGEATNTMSKPTAIFGNAALAVGSIALVRVANRGSTTMVVENATVLFLGFVIGAVQLIIVTKNLGYQYDTTLALVPILVVAAGFTWYALTRP